MKTRIGQVLSSRNFLLLNFASIGGTVAGMGLGYLYQIFAARALSLAEFGVLGVFLGYAALLSVPAASIGAVLSREMAKLEASPEKLNFVLKKYLWKVGGIAAVISAALAVVSALLGQWLWAVVFLGVPFSYAFAVLNAYLQAREKIIQLTAASAGAAALKVAFLVLFIYLGFGLLGALGAMAASGAVAFIALLLYVWPKAAKEAHVEIHLKKAVGVLLATQILMTLLVYFDLFSVRQFLSDEQAGIYNAADLTAKILFYLAGSIGVVLYPKISKLPVEKLKSEGLKLLGLSLAALIPVFIGFQLLATPFMLLFYGEKFASSIGPFKILSIAMLFIGFSQLLTIFLWARRVEIPVLGSYVVAIIALGAALYFAVPSGGLMAAAWSITGAGMLLFILLAIVCVRILSDEKHVNTVAETSDKPL